MAIVSPEKINLFEEEIQSGSAASEDTMQRVAASVNFWNTFYEGQRGWFLNGVYGSLGVPQIGVDGAYPALTDLDVIGFSMYNLVAGSSGLTELDIQVVPPTGPTVSLFTVKPQINFQSGNNSRMIVDVANNVVLAQSTFTTLPTFATTVIQAGSLLTLNLSNAQVGGQSCGLILALRPR